MIILNDLKKLRKLDSFSVLESVSLLPEQIEQAWNEFSQIKIPLRFKGVQNIIVAGMGGSALGARIIDSLGFEVLSLPLEIVNDYHLPAYSDEKTLVVVSSYSGNTEEVIVCLREALRKKSQVFIISTGGKLAKMAENQKIPSYIFKPSYNPSGQPRLGLGYSITAQLALLSKCGFIDLGAARITEAVNFLKRQKQSFSAASPVPKNPAKKLALDLKDKIIVLVAAEHLKGAAHAFKNMINENSKTFAVKFVLPEINHHLLEGLSHPDSGKESLRFLFLESDLYDAEIKKRTRVTREVVEKNGVSLSQLKLTGRNRLIQAFETVHIGGYVSFYLAMLYGIDPAPIPWVDYFKKSLKKYKSRSW